MFQLAFQLVPRLTRRMAGRMGFQSLLVRSDARSGPRSPRGGHLAGILGGNVPTCVPTCSNFDSRRQYGTLGSKFCTFFNRGEILPDFCRKKVQSRGVPTVPTFASSGNSEEKLFFSIVSGSRTSWNLEHFRRCGHSGGHRVPNSTRAAPTRAPSAPPTARRRRPKAACTANSAHGWSK